MRKSSARWLFPSINAASKRKFDNINETKPRLRTMDTTPVLFYLHIP